MCKRPFVYRLIMGDCNVTLNHKEDTKGYITDPHKQSRVIINKEISNESFILLTSSAILTQEKNPSPSGQKIVKKDLGLTSV